MKSWTILYCGKETVNSEKAGTYSRNMPTESMDINTNVSYYYKGQYSKNMRDLSAFGTIVAVLKLLEKYYQKDCEISSNEEEFK